MMRSAVVFNVLIEATLFGTALILLTLLIRKLFRKQLGNRVIYVAWLLVAVRLLLPISLPNPLMNSLRPTNSADATLRPVADQVRVRLTDAALDTAYQVSSQDSQAAEQTVLYQAGMSMARGELGHWALLLYAVGAAGVACWMLVCNCRFRKRMLQKRVDVLTGEVWQEYLELCEQRHTKPLPVWMIDPLPSACLIGVWRPFIALPLSMPQEQQLPALTHEICHHKARDEWWNVVRNLCCIVHWFNPLVWLAASCSRQDSELSCDDRVTAHLSSEQKLAYAQTLVSAAVPKAAPAFGVLATGMTMKGKHLKQRVRGILADRRIRTGAIVAFAVLATAALLIAFATSEQRVTPANRNVAVNNVVVPTSEEQRAYRRDLNNSIDAEDYFQQLLNSRYVATHGDELVPASLVGGKWYLREERGDGTRVSAIFDTEGVITSLRNVGAMEQAPLQNSATPYVIGNGDDSIADYVKAFAYELLPDITFDAIRVTADQQNTNGRFVTCVTENPYTASAHEFIVQLEPSVQIISFRLLDDESKTVVRSSRKLVDGNTVVESTATPEPTVVPTPDTAAFSTLKLYVEGTLIPQMVNRSTDEIAQENTSAWLKAAQDAGMYFTDEWYAELLNRNFCSEFVFRLALSQLGPQAMWTVEQNEWVERMMLQASGTETGSSLVHDTPAEGELSQAEAIALARNTLKQQYSLSDSDMDAMTISAFFSTQIFDTWGEKIGVRIWQVSFYSNGSLVTPTYCVAFSPTGANGCAAKVAQEGLRARIDAMEAEKGRFVLWNAADKATFSEQWPYLQTACNEWIESSHSEMIAHRYGIPPISAASESTACAAALQAAANFIGDASELHAAAGFVTDDANNTYWEVWLADQNNTPLYCLHIANDGFVEPMNGSEKRTLQPDATPAPTPAPNELSQEQALSIAQQALIDTYDLSFSDVARFVVVDPQYIIDFSRNWYGLSPTKPYWWIGFRRPQTEERFYTDYSVLVDAATGEVLQVRDPGNISNG